MVCRAGAFSCVFLGGTGMSSVSNVNFLFGGGKNQTSSFLNFNLAPINYHLFSRMGSTGEMEAQWRSGVSALKALLQRFDLEQCSMFNTMVDGSGRHWSMSSVPRTLCWRFNIGIKLFGARHKGGASETVFWIGPRPKGSGGPATSDRENWEYFVVDFECLRTETSTRRSLFLYGSAKKSMCCTHGLDQCAGVSHSYEGKILKVYVKLETHLCWEAMTWEGGPEPGTAPKAVEVWTET